LLFPDRAPRAANRSVLPICGLLAVLLAVGFRRASGGFADRASRIVALVVLAIGVHSLSTTRSSRTR